MGEASSLPKASVGYLATHGSRRHAFWRNRYVLNASRYRSRLCAVDQRPTRPKQAKRLPSRSGCARCDEAPPALTPQLFADCLKRRPSAAARRRQRKPNTRQLFCRAKVGHFDVDVPLPEISGQRLLRRDVALGQVPVPLGPCRRLTLGQIDGVHDSPTLPAVVGRVEARRQRGQAGRAVLDPDASDDGRVDVERQSLDGAGMLEVAHDRRHAAVLSARDQVERLLVVERLVRLRQPDRDVVGIDHPHQSGY